MNISLSLTDGTALEVLNALHQKYITAKVYFAQYPNEEDTIGMTTPEELKEIYNDLLKQMKDYGLFTTLEFIK
jgi:hypothetical protein